jgi:hypothetical protein
VSATFRTVDGVEVPDPEGLAEGFSLSQAPEGHHVFTINVSAERIPAVFRRLASEVQEPAFFLLETGTHRDVEAELRKDDSDPFHADVHYLDVSTLPEVLAVYDEYEYVLTHDGQVRFGIASRAACDEVYVGRYKVFNVMTSAPGKYVAALRELGIPRVEPLRTVWDTFEKDRPGRRWRLEGITPTLTEALTALKKRGLFLAERRDD